MLTSNNRMMECLRFPEIPQPKDTSSDWAYAMRREMQEIIPGLYLGPYAAAMKSKLDCLLLHNITHIVCIRQSIEAAFIRPNFPDRFKYLVIDMADSVTESIIRHFPKVKSFVEECFEMNGKALIHGNAGISRSAALVIAYIMEKYGLPYNDAFRYVQQRRFCINPNAGFAQQLQEYEPIYKAKLTSEKGQSSQTNGILKRKFVEDDTEDMDMSMSS